mgnify:CR=1 FL=1
MGPFGRQGPENVVTITQTSMQETPAGTTGIRLCADKIMYSVALIVHSTGQN